MPRLVHRLRQQPVMRRVVLQALAMDPDRDERRSEHHHDGKHDSGEKQPHGGATRDRYQRRRQQKDRQHGHRGLVTSADDNSTIGSKVTADIAHSETISTLSSAAASAGSTSGATNESSTRRRSGVRGHTVSPIAATLGRVMSSASSAAGAA